MKIEEIKEKEVWEGFLEKCSQKTFLNSWNWGNFNQKMGNKVWRFGIFEKDLISIAQVIKIEAKRGKFLFLPHCPNSINNSKEKILKIFLEKLKEIGKSENCSFIRIAPIWERNEENERIFKKLNFREAPIHIHPEITWELNLELSDEDLLKGMRKTTRYLIRQALKNKEIEIFEKNDLEGLKKFNEIYRLTAKRHGFVPFSFDYLKNEFLAFSKENQISIFLGSYKKEIVCGGIFIFWQKIGFYHHGASLTKYPKIPVSHFLLWQAIKKAKTLGCKKFNFWGITLKKNHPWAGLSFFKIGFGGQKKEYLKTQDFPLNFKYWFCFLIEKIRKIKRGL